jgi:hypothetical protein
MTLFTAVITEVFISFVLTPAIRLATVLIVVVHNRRQ